MKHELEENMLSPLPIVLVGATVDDRPNYLVIGYVAPFNFGKHIFFSIYKKRHTRSGIHQHKTFSVNIPSVELLEQTKICGSQSGRVIDKSKLFENFHGTLGTAPMIRECPINIECELAEVLDYHPNEGIIGRVVRSYVDPDCLVDGRLDMRRVRPILWATGGDFNYYALGDRVGDE